MVRHGSDPVAQREFSSLRLPVAPRALHQHRGAFAQGQSETRRRNWTALAKLWIKSKIAPAEAGDRECSEANEAAAPKAQWIERSEGPLHLNISMRYAEIIETSTGSGSTAQKVWKQNQKSAEALRQLRSKQADVADARASARALPAGQERSRRLHAADRKDADARRVYGDALSSANDRARGALAKRS